MTKTNLTGYINPGILTGVSGSSTGSVVRDLWLGREQCQTITEYWPCFTNTEKEKEEKMDNAAIVSIEKLLEERAKLRRLMEGYKEFNLSYDVDYNNRIAQIEKEIREIIEKSLKSKLEKALKERESLRTLEEKRRNAEDTIRELEDKLAGLGGK